MPNHRDLIIQETAGLAGGMLAASRPLRILVLGGTGHIGPHHVRAAADRGHHVAVFSRGKTSVEFPPGIERLTGDRNSDLESIRNRDWDAVFDLATYVPAWVRSLGEALRGRVRHYLFISTESVYATPGHAHGTDENSKVLEYTGHEDPYTITKYVPTDDTSASTYGELKVLCEREAEKQFAGKVVILRPGYIVGPGDPMGVFTYWSARLKKGGEILAPGNPRARVQMIDVRDIAEWAVRLAEDGQTGTFNTIGPASPMEWQTMLKVLSGLSSVPTKFTRVPTSWLTERKITSWSNLLFWPTEVGIPGLMSMPNARAHARGLAFRPLLVTARDTLSWYESQPEEVQKKLLLGEGGPDTLENSMAREHQLLIEWHNRGKKVG